MPGRAWRDCELTTRERMIIAVEIGRQVKLVHGCQPVPGGQLHEDWLLERGADAAERHRRWNVLPARLIDQIGPFIADYRPRTSCLVHGDITEDDVFVEDGRLVGLIDWGDAMVTDPFYELGALHLGAFEGDRRLLGSFLEGYGWPVHDDAVVTQDRSRYGTSIGGGNVRNLDISRLCTGLGEQRGGGPRCWGC